MIVLKKQEINAELKLDFQQIKNLAPQLKRHYCFYFNPATLKLHLNSGINSEIQILDRKQAVALSVAGLVKLNSPRNPYVFQNGRFDCNQLMNSAFGNAGFKSIAEINTDF